MVDISGRREIMAGPAWQVREAARQRFIEEIERQIINREGDKWQPDFYRALLQEFERGLFEKYRWSDTRDERAYLLFWEIEKKICRFRHSKKEGLALMAKLFEWTAAQITYPYHSALMNQQMDNPTLIYHTDRATDEVPFE